MVKAKFLKINIKDIALGSLMAFLSSVITGLYEYLNAGKFPSTWVEFKPIIIVGLSSFVAYIIKNFFTNSQGDLLKKEQK
jgi:hypothetical protein